MEYLKINKFETKKMLGKRSKSKRDIRMDDSIYKYDFIDHAG